MGTLRFLTIRERVKPLLFAVVEVVAATDPPCKKLRDDGREREGDDRWWNLLELRKIS